MLLSIAENARVGNVVGDGNDKMIEKLSLISENLNRAADYLTSKAKLVFT